MMANVRSIESANYIALRLAAETRLAQDKEFYMSTQPGATKQTDQDESKGAVEGDHRTDKQQGNENADQPLGADGQPTNRIAIAEDVIGANADNTQG
jgi:hypothetical protein